MPQAPAQQSVWQKEWSDKVSRDARHRTADRCQDGCLANLGDEARGERARAKVQEENPAPPWQSHRGAAGQTGRWRHNRPTTLHTKKKMQLARLKQGRMQVSHLSPL